MLLYIIFVWKTNPYSSFFHITRIEAQNFREIGTDNDTINKIIIGVMLHSNIRQKHVEPPSGRGKRRSKQTSKRT